MGGESPLVVTAVRPGVLQRVQLVLADWQHTGARLVETETAMVAVLDELDLTDLVCSIQGLSAVGAAAILAETGDLTRLPLPAPWSSTPGWPHGNAPPAPTPVGPGSDAPAGPGCGWLPVAPPG